MAEQRLHRFEHVSPIGRWSVTVCTPDPRLADVVATMWYGEGHVTYRRDRILPSGQSQLLINLGPPQYRIEPGPPERRVPFVDIWYSGLHQGPIDTEAPHGNALLGVAFSARGAYPWLGPQLEGLGVAFSARGAYPWLGPQLEGLADRIIALAEALGDGVLALRQRLLDTPHTAERFAIVEQWLIARLSPRQAVHPAVRWAVDRIAASGGKVPVAQLALQTGYTRKHLAGLFVRQVGLTPKALCRIHRFRGALALLDGVTQVPWAALADQCGYYDQSHLIHDFRSFAGLSPAELVRQTRPDPGSVVLR